MMAADAVGGGGDGVECGGDNVDWKCVQKRRAQSPVVAEVTSGSTVF